MPKFLVKWKEVVDWEAEIEAKNKEETKKKAIEHDYECEVGKDVIDAQFQEGSIEIKEI